MREKSFQYMLRRTLPLWKWEEIAKETIEHCRKTGIKEIIWMIDPEDFTHGLPTLEHIQEYIPVLKRIQAMQEPYGIRFSINPWVTLGHVERGRDMTKVHPGMSFMTDQHGHHSSVIACPLSEEWQRWISDAYSLYATLDPYILWLEDDFRLFHHENIIFGCFCPLHLQEFSTWCGYHYTREELLEVLLKKGEPHPHRALWLEMNASSMEQAMKQIEGAVHSTSPSTQLGLMCSNPTHHAVEGRDWQKLMDALCGTTQTHPVARPSMGSYNEFETMDVLEGLDGARITMALLPENTILCPELESCFYSTYAKSARHTGLQVGLSALTGATHLTMNLFDFIGGNIPEQDAFLDILKAIKPRLDTLALLQSEPRSDKQTGSVLIEFPWQGAKSTQIEGTKGDEASSSMHALAPKTTGWSRALQPCGIPISFQEGQVQAVTGQYFRGKSREEIKKLLAKPLLLDGSAAFNLCQLGFGKDIGVEKAELFEQNSLALGAEEFHHPAFGGADALYMTVITTTLHGMFAALTVTSETEIVSSLTDPDRNRILPCMTAFENSLGGKIIVYAGDLSQGFSAGLKTCFLNPVRERQLAGAVRWLSGESLGLQNTSGAYHITLTRRYEDFLFVGVANLSTDNCKQLTFRTWNLPPIESIYILGKTDWEPAQFIQQGEKLTLQAGLDYKDFSALKLYFA